MQNNQNNDNSVSDYKELVDFLAGQFDKINEKLDQKADKSDIDKIYKILETKADKSDMETKADKSDIDLVLTRINLLGNKIDDNRAEQIGVQHQLDKHEKWHTQTAAKIAIKLLAE